MASTSWPLTHLAIVAVTIGLWRYGPQSLPVVRFGLLGCFAILYAAGFAIWLVYARFIWPLWLSPLTKLPQPKGGNWLNGHFWEIFMAGQGEVERVWIHEMPSAGFIYYRSILNTPRVVATTPKAVQEICTRTNEFIKPALVKGLAGRVLGAGLVLSELAQHKWQRRVFLPIFAPRHTREMFPIFWRKTRQVTQKLAKFVSETSSQSHGDDAVFEVGHWASRTALDIVTMATLGEDFGSIQDENAPLAKTYRRAIEPSRGHIVHALLKVWLPQRLVDLAPNRWNRTINESVPVFRNLCRRLLRERRQEAANKSDLGKDLLSLCFRYEEVAGADEEEVIDQMTTFLAAGHETISVGITWAIYMLCLRPEWQTILRKEARLHLPDPNAVEGIHDQEQIPMATHTNVDDMPMLQAFIHEVLRWFPPIPHTLREPLQDTVIDGMLIPKGTWIVLPIKGMNRDERCWGPDAKDFNPKRWLNPDSSFNTTGGCTNKYADLSFMQGVRSCIAQGFSKSEMACVVGAWVGRFEFELADPALLDVDRMKISRGSLSARPRDGLFVKWRTVDGW
ncbi:hypothetical protein HIM_08297 [Hirsutella minnesotensis 3608]|uniref:Cytochrome P450 n=1 Tax=Hirsutella minnesotensis 3608 TaxID=1043627 RepID=A0A0F7ZHB9_9HYPO|nr:hypothetical protein HIM_08297 [Hirsutella minnesotensis 3608]